MPKHLTLFDFKSLLPCTEYMSRVNELVHLMLPQLAHKFTLRLCVCVCVCVHYMSVFIYYSISIVVIAVFNGTLGLGCRVNKSDVPYIVHTLSFVLFEKSTNVGSIVRTRDDVTCMFSPRFHKHLYDVTWGD